MAALAYQQIAITGVAVTYAAATVTVGDTLPPDDRGWFEVANASGGSITATLTIPGSTFGQANPDVAVTVANGATKRIGPLTAGIADPTTGLCTLICSSVTSVTIAGVRC